MKRLNKAISHKLLINYNDKEPEEDPEKKVKIHMHHSSLSVGLMLKTTVFDDMEQERNI